MLKRADCTYPWWSKNVEASMDFAYTRMPLEDQSESSFAFFKKDVGGLDGGNVSKICSPEAKDLKMS